MILLNELNERRIREEIRTAPAVLFVSPHTGGILVIAGGAAIEAARQAGQAGFSCVQLSVDPDSHEWEWAKGAVLAIRGAIDTDPSPKLRELAEVMREHWEQGRDVPLIGELEHPDEGEDHGETR